MEKEILIEFVKWLRSEYQIEEVYEMFADEFLQDRARKNLDQSDVIKSVCGCGYDGTYEKEGLIFCQCCDNRKI
jgi:hypothetical protein